MQRGPPGRACGGKLLGIGEPESGEHHRWPGDDKHANPSHIRTLAYAAEAHQAAAKWTAARPAGACNEASGRRGRAPPSGSACDLQYPAGRNGTAPFGQLELE